MDTITDTITYDGLLVGDFPQLTDACVVGLNQTLLRGTVVGKITASGYLIACDHTASDGSQTPYGVMVEAVTTAGAIGAGLLYVFGAFDESKLTFGGSSVLADLKDAMKNIGLFAVTVSTP